MKKKVFTGEPILKGSKGLAVMVVQVALLALDYNKEKMEPDGDYGDETEAAIRDYKKISNVKGIEEEEGIGPLMVQALKDEDGIDLTQVSFEEEPVE